MTKDLAPPSSASLERPSARRQYLANLAADKRARGVPHNTKRAYDSDWRQFEGWCKKLGYQALPASEEALCSFLAHLSEDRRIRTRKKEPRRGDEVQGYSYQPTSIERKLTSIVKKHRQAKLESPRTEAVTLQMHAIWLERDSQPRAAAPLLGSHLKLIAGKMTEVTAYGDGRRDVTLRDQAALLLGWHCALRRSEVAALKLSSIEFFEQGITVHIGRSKTDQEGKGRKLWIRPVKSAPSACPVLALEEWLKVRGEASGPLFWRSRHSQLSPHEPMPAWQLTTIIDRWVRLAGAEPESKDTEFSPHSLRAGFITHAIRKRLPYKEVMQHSGHASYRAFMGYVRVATGFDATVQDNILEET